MINGIRTRFQVVATCGSSIEASGGRADIVQKGVVAVNGATPCCSSRTETIGTADKKGND